MGLFGFSHVLTYPLKPKCTAASHELRRLERTILDISQTDRAFATDVGEHHEPLLHVQQHPGIDGATQCPTTVGLWKSWAPEFSSSSTVLGGAKQTLPLGALGTVRGDTRRLVVSLLGNSPDHASSASHLHHGGIDTVPQPQRRFVSPMPPVPHQDA